MNILITGGCGFIGFNFASKLSAQGHRVIVIDNLSRSGSWQNLNSLLNMPNIKFVNLDIRSDLQDPIFSNILEEADFVFHLAAQVAVTKSIDNPMHDFQVNALGTFNLLEKIRTSKRRPGLIFSSTNKVYGSLEHIATIEEKTRYFFENKMNGISEDYPLDFHSPYGCSKGTADQYVLDYARIYNLKTVVFRQSCIYGENQFGIEDQGWVAWMTIAKLLEKNITVFGNGKQVRDLLHVDDLYNAFLMAAKNIDRISGEAFNMGGGHQNTLSILELLDFLNSRFKGGQGYNFESPRKGDQKIFIADLSKANRELEWSPQVTISTGLERLLNWSRENLGAIRKVLK